MKARFLPAKQTARVFRTAFTKHIHVRGAREDYVDVVVIRPVPSVEKATASVSTREGSAVAARIERLKSETKERAKKSSVRRANVPARGRGVSKIWHLGVDLPHGSHTEVFFSQRSFSGPSRNLQTSTSEILKRYQMGALARSTQAGERRGLFFIDRGRSKLWVLSFPDRWPRNTQIFAKLRKLFLFGSASEKIRREIRGEGGS
jgi:hypothetical protein